jgi:hypothetical protein
MLPATCPIQAGGNTGISPPARLLLTRGSLHGATFFTRNARVRAARDGQLHSSRMAMEFAAQRLEMGDVVLIDLPEENRELEATVVRPIDRTEWSVRALLRAQGREDFVKEWPLGQMVTVIRGP